MNIGLPVAKSSPTDKRLFVSYSHHDTNLVGSVVSLLRATKGSPVFQDRDTILPGTSWQAEIEHGLAAADTVVVFWCCHAAASKGVRDEWLAAIGAKKQLLPLLLDATPLPEELARFQWIDFQEYGARSHRKFWQNPVAIGLTTLGFVGAVSLSLFLRLESPAPEGSVEQPKVTVPAVQSSPSPSAEAPAAAPQPEQKIPAPRPARPEAPSTKDKLVGRSLLPWILLWIGVVGVVIFLYRRWRKPDKEKLFDERTRWPVSAIHREMANAIVAELSKRPS